MINCTEKNNCAVFDVEPDTTHVLRIMPLHPYPNCDFFEAKIMSADVDDIQERIMRMAGCLQ